MIPRVVTALVLSSILVGCGERAPSGAKPDVAGAASPSSLPLAPGDTAEKAEESLRAAGWERVLMPTTPVEHLAPPDAGEGADGAPKRLGPSTFSWYFKSKDGVEITVLVKGGKVISVEREMK